MVNIKVIFWDFDGVLIDSHMVRDLGFERVLAEFPKEQVEQLLAFHRANGGLSRYIKFRHFFEEIRQESITNDQILVWAERFSAIMKEFLVNPELLIQETLNFVKQNQRTYSMHITSGSDQEELRYLCTAMYIDHLFNSIHGSPVPKIQWVRELIKENGYNVKECVLIGDSINDWEAAQANGIHFFAFNGNDELHNKSTLMFSLK